ncbi:DUF5121 domain-containing protein [Sphingobacterium sp. HJSM2_6]|uniref:DUF5121 domain-containing protein n=1 Tax=Sphingobacterium sp. HJSM2_6 TaxID=3366264 RepID=UPI003BE21DB0
MKKLIKNSIYILLLALVASCKEEELIVPIGGGSPTIDVKLKPETAHFGDSIPFTVSVADQGVKLSTVKAQLLFNEEVVAEQIIRTKEYGDYSGKLFVPFLKDIPNGSATLKFTLQNVELVKAEKTESLPITRPDFPFLNFVTAAKTYKMERVAANQYELTENLPFKIAGYIEAPAFGSLGNLIQFGWENDAVTQGITQNIPFSNSSSGVYTIAFNTLTYAASPFIIGYAFNGEGMRMLTDDLYAVDIQVTEGQEITIDGIDGLSTWWIDEDYIRQEGGKYYFNASTGKYRFYANFDKSYVFVEAMNGNNLATLNADGTGAIWIIGEGIGKPTVAGNEVGWNTDNALCLAPIGNKRYRVTVVAGQSIRASTINFKFFHQKGWGGEYKNTELSTTSDIIFVGDGTNGRDPGNLGILTGKTLENNAKYEFVVDLSEGNDKAKLTVTKK